VRGRWVPLSLPRRMMADAMHFALGVPSVVVQRRLALAPLVEVRKAAGRAVPWSAIITKAYAMTANEFPELRRVYLKLPVPHFYEYPASIASVTIEREHEGERYLVGCQIKDPAALPLPEIGRRIRHVREAPLAELRHFRRALAVARLPWPLRRLLWWLALNIGRQRANQFGTFGMSAIPEAGVEVLQPRTVWTSFIAYGYGSLNDDGKLTVTITWDHRAFEAATAGRILARLEAVLNGPIADELRALKPQSNPS
jgi:hypothetical protein